MLPKIGEVVKSEKTKPEKTFREFLFETARTLSEAPQAMPGDAPFEEVSFDKISDTSKTGMDIYFTLVKSEFVVINGDKLDLYVSNTHPYYKLGRFYLDSEENNKYRFAVVFDISFTELTLHSQQKQINDKSTVKINTVHTAKDFRFNKIATKVYKELLKRHQIMSDQLQYQGAVNLWKSLIEDKNINVWIYNILEDKIISKATKLTDISHIWSDDTSRIKIRLIAQNS